MVSPQLQAHEPPQLEWFGEERALTAISPRSEVHALALATLYVTAQGNTVVDTEQCRWVDPQPKMQGLLLCGAAS